MMSFITGSDINILSKEKTAIVLRRFARQTWLRKRIYHTAQKLSKRLSQVFLAKRHNTTAISALHILIFSQLHNMELVKNWAVEKVQ